MKKNDPDYLALKRCVKALEASTPRMRAATIQYLWDRFVGHPKADDDTPKQAAGLRAVLG